MKKLLSILAILSIATAAFAVPSHMEVPGVVIMPDLTRDIIYDQGPYALAAGNAQLANNAEIADDIPGSLVGQTFNQVGVYCIQWGATGADPIALNVNIYDGSCPPAMAASQSFTIAWGDMAVTDVSESGYWIFYMVANLGDPITITEDMSLGFQIDLGHGADAPYGGFLATEETNITDCESYRDGETWGYPRWTPYSQTTTTGAPRDLAYTLGLLTTAAEAETWSTLKVLY
ncbi:MAG: hypothetical protein GY835_25550 [bacterium]|nr:hypothetical protein [bacterium]